MCILLGFLNFWAKFIFSPDIWYFHSNESSTHFIIFNLVWKTTTQPYQQVHIQMQQPNTKWIKSMHGLPKWENQKTSGTRNSRESNLELRKDQGLTRWSKLGFWLSGHRVLLFAKERSCGDGALCVLSLLLLIFLFSWVSWSSPLVFPDVFHFFFAMVFFFWFVGIFFPLFIVLADLFWETYKQTDTEWTRALRRRCFWSFFFPFYPFSAVCVFSFLFFFCWEGSGKKSQRKKPNGSHEC